MHEVVSQVAPVGKNGRARPALKIAVSESMVGSENKNGIP
jgi:hypothetical protein